jgi:hypothetical protein
VESSCFSNSIIKLSGACEKWIWEILFQY